MLLKHTTIAAIAAVILGCISASAKIDGKMYATGDTIMLGGMSCLVFKVNDDGLTGKAITPYKVDSKTLADIESRAAKSYDKLIKKGKATEEDKELIISGLKAMDEMPGIRTEKVKGGLVWHVDEFDAALKAKYGNNWRIPNSQDADDWVNWQSLGKAGLGVKHRLSSPDKLMSAKENIWANHWKGGVSFSMALILQNKGFVCSNTAKLGDTKFLSALFSVSGCSFTLDNEFSISTKEVAVVDF